MITICLTYFKSLTLANFAAALYSVRRQNLGNVKEILIVDNNSPDVAGDIQRAIDSLKFPIPVRLFSFKTNVLTATHSWSTNAAVHGVKTTWFLFTRADYLLDFGLLGKLVGQVDLHPTDWNGFVTSDGWHSMAPIGECEKVNWREAGAEVARHPTRRAIRLHEGRYGCLSDA